MRDRPTNRLGRETSPYLLQHAHNPVDWYPWGEEAIAAARAADRPIFLSVGYSSCHWCHVMEHESFEDPATARLMNELFVNIKVDREERPDLDEIYMQAVQLFTGGHGGWPMSLFLTPQLEPFLGGTYFPPAERHGMPSFRTVLEFAARSYRDRRDDVAQTSAQVVAALQGMAAVEAGSQPLAAELLRSARDAFGRNFDAHNGGFGHQPKFPPSMALAFLLRQHARDGDTDSLHIVRQTLRRMARGGIHDQLGGGFHRYSVDAHWLVPHFEKMLYDNALLARVYTEAWQACGDPEFRRVALDILAYVGREMTSPAGGFYSAQDADSEGVEGRYFVWTPDEIDALLEPEEARVVRSYYGVTAAGNFEHETTILSVPRDPDVVAADLGLELDELEGRLAVARPKLLDARRRRVPPGRDDKIIVAWNGLMISAFARAYSVWGDAEHLRRAIGAAEFVLAGARDGVELFRTAKDGERRGRGFLDDDAGFLAALLDLYEATFEPRWIEAAIRLEAHVSARFWDEKDGGYFYTSSEHEKLLARSRHPFDNATPSGNALMVTSLLRLAALGGDTKLRDRAERTLQLFADAMRSMPSGMAEMLCGLDLWLGPMVQVAVTGRGKAAAALAAAARTPYLPRKVLAGWPETGEPARLALLADRQEIDGRPAAYVCRDFTCELPAVEPAALETSLAAAARSG